MANLLSPGVQIQETDLSEVIPQTSTNIGGYVGYFKWGPINEVVTVSNEKELVNIYGAPTEAGPLEDSFFTAAGFLAYGNHLKVVRAGGNVTYNSTSGIDTLQIQINTQSDLDGNMLELLSGGHNIVARYPGATGDTIAVYAVMGSFYEKALAANPILKYNLTYKPTATAWSQAFTNQDEHNAPQDEIAIVVVDQGGELTGAPGTVLEVFEGLSVCSNARDDYGSSNNWASNINARSKYIWVAADSPKLKYNDTDLSTRTTLLPAMLKKTFILSVTNDNLNVDLTAAEIDAILELDLADITLEQSDTIASLQTELTSTQNALTAAGTAKDDKTSANDTAEADVESKKQDVVDAIAANNGTAPTTIDLDVVDATIDTIAKGLSTSVDDYLAYAKLEYAYTGFKAVLPSTAIPTNTESQAWVDDASNDQTTVEGKARVALQEAYVYWADNMTGDPANEGVVQEYLYGTDTVDGLLDLVAQSGDDASAKAVSAAWVALRDAYVTYIGTSIALDAAVETYDAAKAAFDEAEAKLNKALQDYMVAALELESDDLVSTLASSIKTELKYGQDVAPGQELAAFSSDGIIAASEFFADSETMEVDLLFAQQVEEGTDGGGAVDKNLVAICSQRGDCMAICSAPVNAVVDAATDQDKENAVIAKFASFPSSSYYEKDSSPLYVYNSYRDAYVWIPASGHVAGLHVANNLDPWISPAGLNKGQFRNVIKLAFNPALAHRDNLYSKNINPLVAFPGQGIVLWGDKTGLAKPSAFDRINVRRLFISCEKAISRAAKFKLFEQNDEYTRAAFLNAIVPFLRDIQGRRGITDFKVVCDETNNTGDVIDTNRFVASIYIQPTRSINFITLNFVATRTGVSFDVATGAK